MKQAILVIDMLNDFVTGKLACKNALSIIKPIQKLILTARQKSVPIIYVNDAHTNKDHELNLWGEHAIKSTKGAEIIPQLKPFKKIDYVIDKHHFSGFFDTKLQQVLKKLNIKALIVVGLQAHICIAHTIADAYQWGYEITIPKDGICSFSKEIYRHSLKYFQKTYGAKITTIDTIIKSL